MPSDVTGHPSRWHWWPDVTLLALGALAVRIPSMFAPTQLGYDDGGYGLAAIAMRQGYEPFRNIFSPQGPLFLPLVHVADRIGLSHLNAPRLLPVLAGIVVTLAVYSIGVQTMDRGRALLAAGLAAASGVLLWTTGPLTGDGPAAAFATSAVAAAVAYRTRPDWWRVIAITLLAGAAVSTKSLLVGPALLVAWFLVATRRRWLHIVLVPVGAFAVVGALSLPWGVQHVLDDYVRYHLDKTSNRKPGANFSKLWHTFSERDTFLTLLAALAVVTALLARLSPRRFGSWVPERRIDSDEVASEADPTRFFWWWAGLAFVVLLLQDPMFRNHLSALVAPATLLVARYRPSWRVVVIAGLVAIPFQIVTLRPLLLPHDYTGRTAEVVDALRGLPPHAWALSDEPGLVWRAGHATDPFYVDASVLRIDSDVQPILITEDRVVHAASQPRVCAVVITSPQRFGSWPDLPDRLEQIGYHQSVELGEGRGLWEREQCADMRRATRDSLIVGAVALLVRIPAFFAPQSLGFDDGQFAMSVIAMRHGGLPFREVFSSQGPLFLPIAWLGDLLTFRTINSPRAASVLAGVALTVLVLHLSRRLTGPGAARFAALLVALSGSVLWTTAPLTSDGIGAALTVATALAAVVYWQRPSMRRILVVGLLAGAALAVKSLLVIPGLVAAALWVLLRRRVRDIISVPIVAVVVVLLVSAPWGLSRVYDQYVRYHTDAVADRPIGANLHKLVSTFVERDLPLLAAGVVTALLLLVLVVRSRRTGGGPSLRRTADGTVLAPWFPVAVWFVLTLLVVLTESPMWRNHVAHVAVPFVFLVGIGLGVGASAERYVAVAAGIALLAAPWTVVHLGEILRPQESTGNTAALEHRLRNLPPGALAISDTPGLVWRAGRRVPDRYVDVSILRITSPTPALALTEDDIVRDARAADVCAVVRWSDKRFTHFPGLGRRLRAEGYRPELRRPHSPEVLWRKVRCRPAGPARADRTSAAVAPVRLPG